MTVLRQELMRWNIFSTFVMFFLFHTYEKNTSCRGKFSERGQEIGLRDLLFELSGVRVIMSIL